MSTSFHRSATSSLPPVTDVNAHGEQGAQIRQKGLVDGGLFLGGQPHQPLLGLFEVADWPDRVGWNQAVPDSSLEDRGQEIAVSVDRGPRASLEQAVAERHPPAFAVSLEPRSHAGIAALSGWAPPRLIAINRRSSGLASWHAARACGGRAPD